MNEVKLIIDAKASLGEGPIWDHEKKFLYWIDIINKEIRIFDPNSGSERIIKTEQSPGTVVKGTNERLVLAFENGFYFLDLETEKVSFIADPESDIPDNRFNDGKCDPAGRFWAGTVGEEAGKAGLYCLDTDLSVTKKIENVTISNGIVWNVDTKKMYYIDTPTNEVWGFDYDLKTGNISKKEVVVNIPKDEGHPDGMTIDSEGMLWVAHWSGWRVSKWDPTAGKKLDEIKVPVSQVTACAFGGYALDELYITTARIGLSDKDLKEQPDAGGLFCVKTDVKGIPAYKFKG